MANIISAEELVGEEWAEWYRLKPLQGSENSANPHSKASIT
jgi:hypothetical protein